MTELIQATHQTGPAGLVSPQLTTTLEVVAREFGKRHRDVCRAIRTLSLPVDFRWRNFALREEIQHHSTGSVKKTVFDMTRDGFVILAMGFTGKEAMDWKLKFLDAFNQMEAKSKPQFPCVTPDMHELDAALEKAVAIKVKQALPAIEDAVLQAVRCKVPTLPPQGPRGQLTVVEMTARGWTQLTVMAADTLWCSGISETAEGEHWAALYVRRDTGGSGRQKRTWWLSHNGKRFARSKDLRHLQDNDPAVLDWVEREVGRQWALVGSRMNGALQ